MDFIFSKEWMLVEFLLIYPIFGVICAVIAGTKGRSGVGWFFGGYFLGLIGLIIVGCLKNIDNNDYDFKSSIGTSIYSNVTKPKKQNWNY